MKEIQKNKVILIAYVWPEPQSSAAGLRTVNLIDTFLSVGWEVVVASPSQKNEHMQRLVEKGVRVQEIRANDAFFDGWIRGEQPHFVIFDRFVIEEQFGWRVQEAWGDAIRIVDAQDLHFLRRTRAALLKKGQAFSTCFNGESLNPELINEDLFREIASFFRSDGVFVLSSFEESLLLRQFHFAQDCLLLNRFQYEEAPDPRPFEVREGFVMIGNMRHAPNEDAIFWLHREIWPRMRRLKPDARVHIYGAYPSRAVMQLNRPDQGWMVHGPAKDQFQVLSQHRVNLAPLRFGAGIKGKISDGWWCGTPVLTTSIGAEGMAEEGSFAGCVEDDPQLFAEAAVTLYEQKERWLEHQQKAQRVIQSLYSRERNQKELLQFMMQLQANFLKIRSRNWIGAMLGHHSWRSTKYFSRWIEEKSKGLGNEVCLNRS